MISSGLGQTGVRVPGIGSLPRVVDERAFSANIGSGDEGPAVYLGRDH